MDTPAPAKQSDESGGFKSCALSRCFNLDDRQNQRCGSPDIGIKIRISMREIFQKYWRHSNPRITLGA